MIQMHEVSIRAGTFSLSGVSLQIKQGEYAVLMGRTGHGKSTILEAICGLRQVTAGAIIIAGNDVTRASPAARSIGYVPQDLALFPTMSVREQLEFALRLRRVPSPERRARVDEVARLLGIDHLLQRSVKRLSGGESQRVALGRALSFRPAVLLLDEPLSALDEATRGEIQTLLREIQRTTGVTTLHVTHSRGEARALADRLLILDQGRVVEADRQSSTAPLPSTSEDRSLQDDQQGPQ